MEMDLTIGKLLAASAEELRGDLEDLGTNAPGLNRRHRELLWAAADNLERAGFAIGDLLGEKFGYFGQDENVDAEIVEEETINLSNEQSIVSGDPFWSEEHQERQQRERALDMAVRSDEKGDTVEIAEGFLAFMKGDK